MKTDSGLEKIVVDTYAWIEYFRGSEEGKRAKTYIDGDYLLLTPPIVVAELSDKYWREGKEDRWDVRKHFVRLRSDVLDLDYELADEAGRLKRELRADHDTVGLADAIILAHARAEDAVVLTGDQHLTGQESVIDVSIR